LEKKKRNKGNRIVKRVCIGRKGFKEKRRK